MGVKKEGEIKGIEFKAGFSKDVGGLHRWW